MDCVDRDAERGGDAGIVEAENREFEPPFALHRSEPGNGFVTDVADSTIQWAD